MPYANSNIQKFNMISILGFCDVIDKNMKKINCIKEIQNIYFE